MANWSGLNKLRKVHQLLANRNAHLNQISCRSLAAATQTASNSSLQRRRGDSVSHSPLRPFTFQWQLQRHMCSKDTLEEFRVREELREAELERAENAKKQSEREAKNEEVEAIRTKILEAALPHVFSLGWTREAIVQGAEEAGYPSVIHGMFPLGGFELVSYFNGKCNNQLVQAMQQETNNGTKEIVDPLEFLTRFVRMRLEMIGPYRNVWPQAMALIVRPENASKALAQVLTLVDDMCYYSGDRSVDITWYTRRVGLGAILKMTELFWLQDKSPENSKTWDFLRDRLEEAVHIQAFLHSSDDITDKVQKSFNSAFITARNILGLGYNRP